MSQDFERVNFGGAQAVSGGADAPMNGEFEGAGGNHQDDSAAYADINGAADKRRGHGEAFENENEASAPFDTANKNTAVNSQVPNELDGLPADLFDENGLKQEAALTALKEAMKEKQKKDKQILDLRRVISKGVDVPKDPAQYDSAYKPAPEYEHYYKDETGPIGQFVQSAMGRINEVAYSKAMNKDQAAAVKDLFNEMMTSVHVFDDASEEAQLQKEAYQEKVLGANAKHIIAGNKKTLLNYNGFDDQEKKALSVLMDKDPVVVGALDKLRQLAFGTRGGIPAREYTASSGLADDHTLAAEYANPSTTNKRREEIINQRVAAGRTGPLPITL